MKKQLKSDLLLLLVTIFWGTSYYLTDISLSDLPPMCLNAFRFLSAFLVIGLFLNKKLRSLNKETIKYSLLVGVALSGTYIFYGYGILKTSLTNAAFICSIPVVFTPIFSYIFERRVVKKKMLFCILICIVGLAFLTLNDGLQLSIGDIICLGVPICYALDITLTDKAVRCAEVDALGLGICSLGVVGIITLVISLLLEQPHLPTTLETWISSLALGFFCSGFAFVIQTIQQKYTTPNHIGLIFTLEPIFATIIAIIFANEVVTNQKILGMVLMISSLILMEIDLPVKKHIKNSCGK
ncbi:DMT family transporter [Clostridium perfringens]